MSRGWNSRLGFSLRNEPNSMQTTISAIYSDSVAAKDGRLRVGDKILMVRSTFQLAQVQTFEWVLFDFFLYGNVIENGGFKRRHAHISSTLLIRSVFESFC